MKANNYGIKTIRLLIMVFIFIYSAFTISAIGKNSDNTDSSSIICSEKDMNESYYNNINEVKNTASFVYERDVSITISTEDQIYNPSINEKSWQYVSSRDVVNTTSRCPQGFIWMSVDNMQDEINTFELKRYYDEVDSETCSVPVYNLNPDVFYDIINTIKKYDWKDHREHINAYELNACEITIIGNNTVYTYLICGRDKSGRGFVWSFYDYKIAYLSEQDYKYIENTFLNIK